MKRDGAAAAGSDTGFSRREGRAIIGISLAYFLVIFDAGVLNLALPSIQARFDTSLSQAQWVLDAYSLPLAALLLGAGRFGDRFGHRRLLIVGVAVFTAASALAMVSPSLGWLVFARAVEGTGGAVLLPATLATISHAFRPGAARARATMIWVGTGAAAMALAPVVGGILLSTWGWRSVFAINLPLGGLSIMLVLVGLHETTRSPSARLNTSAQLLMVLVLGTLSGGIVLLGDRAVPPPVGLGLIAAGACATVALITLNIHSAAPLIPRGYFSLYARSAAIISAGGMGFVFYGSFLALSVLFQATGRNALQAGIMLLPMTVASVAGPLFAHRILAKRFRPATILSAGFAIAAAGGGFLAAAQGNPYVIVLVGMVAMGAMSTVCFSALTTLLMTHTTADLSGLSSGLQNTTRQAGSLLAYSVVGAILAQRHFTAAMAVVIVVCVACAAVNLTARAPSPVHSRDT